ncbi:MAG TPA: hypothetical protein VK428_02875, partial [Acidimicrobiales bacterium]|nr:hypothetical protein [Acidimicrobiales bacterium]
MSDSRLPRRIWWLGLFIVLCFVAVFLQLNNLQVLQANKLANSSRNPAVIAARYDQRRGDITSAEGTILAQSVKAAPGSAFEY